MPDRAYSRHCRFFFLLERNPLASFFERHIVIHQRHRVLKVLNNHVLTLGDSSNCEDRAIITNCDELVGVVTRAPAPIIRSYYRARSSAYRSVESFAKRGFEHGRSIYLRRPMVGHT